MSSDGHRAPRARLRRWRRILVGLLCAPLALSLAVELIAAAGSFPAADLAPPSGSTRLFDRQGALLREVVDARGARSRWIPLARISPALIAATIAVEDARFFRHRGIDDVGVLRAIVDNLRSRRIVSGASTISMQTARLIHPHERQRTLGGKLREALEARRLERALSKHGILEQYLNRAPYGPALIGAEAASQRYFGKPASALTLAEAALLAGLPKAPSALDPRRHPAAARQRRQHVLERLRASGWIDGPAFAAASRTKLALARPKRLSQPTLHATDWALRRLRRAGRRDGDHRLTLDRGLSRDIARIVQDHLDSVVGAGATQASVVVLDHASCDVRALVGSRGYFQGEHGAVNGALSPRQPGSALKPFTYALAFERGDSPASVVADIETRYGGPRGEFRPRNYTGDFSGPVLMADALGRSLNVPAVRVAQRLGARALLTRLRELGFDSLRRSAAHYGLGLTLGNGEVTLVELAQAYATLARRGKACRARLLATDPPSPTHAIFSPGVAFVVSQALSEQHLRLEAFGPANALMFDYPVAVKTGTSTDFRDNWAAGFAGRYTVAVWLGDFEGRSLNQLSGARGAGPLFARVIQRLIGKERPQRADPPTDVLRTTVCGLSGKLPGPHCPHRRSLFVQRSAAPRERCDWHRTIALDQRNGLRAGPSCAERHVQEEVYTVLPPLYARWQSEQGQRQPPASYSPRCPAGATKGPGKLAIVSPKPGDVYLLEPGYDRRTQTIELQARADRPVPQLTWRLDGRKIATARLPYSARWPLAPGRHVLTVEAKGQRGDRVEFEVR